MLKGSRLQVKPENDIPAVIPPTILWDDPLLAIGWQCYPARVWPKVLEEIEKLKAEIQSLPEQTGPVDWKYFEDLVEVLFAKLTFQKNFTTAYENADKPVLRQLADKALPDILCKLEALEQSYCRQWLRRNKPLGMEAIQIRFGAMRARCAEAARRIDDYLRGRISRIEEIEVREKNLPCEPVTYFYWLTTGSVVI